jgi:hypothetical protein
MRVIIVGWRIGIADRNSVCGKELRERIVYQFVSLRYKMQGRGVCQSSGQENTKDVK